ncbi:MAG TPA: flavodoxin-dependent (E)-4-hydroxy-3-methylbut-2-enyl-diphosphate synthase [Bacillota bacterium]|nr:flavodoxin-dependent (E)-4-hydroxy-3-methylbut-2-enyl-diphosphate synthase [Bacillota bacterium]HQI16745.1 flavodoxin-dependent (E)-4-hydroxy-3-methylbut-2-enyl-diphosphate synthase [Bacillota bacterium]HQJ38226.1 flavodoxin-dependent (E)-4-hydroxy-3-methylbut-2-enyl-diphosphate synthase [Bacillota bacterium]HRS20285.1 flavodoxin-dependent (E)-4-hydroxy-3-methylbut-2-enyl-diphosphate synthase [Clostridia bacterium]
MGAYTRKIRIGDRYIGGGEPILIQSMTNTRTQDKQATIEQIKRLEAAGCDIVRIAVPDAEAAEAVKDIKSRISIPLVADIHFDYRLAIQSIINGADKIRINPGNIGDSERVKKVVDAAKERDIPIRIGINSGSLEKEILEKYGSPTADALVESALNNVKLLEDMDFNDIVISIKSSDVMLTIDSYIKASKAVSYPLHLGITEAGTLLAGSVKSSVGLGILLYNGIGDTIRVSLTGDPVDEIYAAKEILKSLKLLKEGIEIISCPTCGRTCVDLVRIAEEVEERIRGIKVKKPMKLAIMGCAVNGPGEAKEADLGIAGGQGEFLLFLKGKIVRKVPQENVIEELIKEIEALQSV